jgi:hypothetical protein
MTTAWLTALPTPRQRAPHVGRRAAGDERREERPERGVVGERRDQPADDAGRDGEDVEERGGDHQREEAWDDELLDRIDAEHLQRVELLADLAGAEVGGDRRAGDARR